MRDLNRRVSGLKCFCNIVKILVIFMKKIKVNSISNIYKLSVSVFYLKSVKFAEI
jgi:hypothetical protein